MAMSKTAPIFEIYTDRKGEFRWRAKARNGNVLAAASEGYTNKRDAVHCAKLFGYDPMLALPEPKKLAVKKASAAKAPAAKAVAKKTAAPKPAEAPAAMPAPKPKRAPKAAAKPVAA